MIKIPKDVYDAINDGHSGFDKMYYSFLGDSKSNKEAFEKTMDRIQEHFPKYRGYSCYNSYQAARNKRVRKMLLKRKRRAK